MHRVQPGPWTGFAGVLALVAVVATAVRIDALGWLAAACSGATVAVLLSGALARRGSRALGPADRVTLLRAVLVCGVVALAAGATGGRTVLVGLATLALVLDGVDGRVARRTGTVSPLGARFDLEVDAFLILVLSLYVAPTAGWWVLLIGAARYALLGAARVFPWLREELPPRPWCKVVAVVQGVALAVAAAAVLPLPVARFALAGALVLLVESFGREVRDLWRLRCRVAAATDVPARVQQAAGHAG